MTAHSCSGDSSLRRVPGAFGSGDMRPNVNEGVDAGYEPYERREPRYDMGRPAARDTYTSTVTPLEYAESCSSNLMILSFTGI